MSAFLRSFIANGWPTRLVFIPWLGIAPIACAVLLARKFATFRQPLSSAADLFMVTGFAVYVWLVCFLIALVLGSISTLLLYPFFDALDRWAGVTEGGDRSTESTPRGKDVEGNSMGTGA